MEIKGYWDEAEGIYYGWVRDHYMQFESEQAYLDYISD